MSRFTEIMHWNRPALIPVTRAGIGNYMLNVQEEISRVITRFVTAAEVRLTDWDQKAPGVMPLDVVENGMAYTITADLPGYEPRDIDVQVAGGFLTIRAISAETEETADSGRKYLRRERAQGLNQRTVALPDAADTEKAEAFFRNGILTVVVSKYAAMPETSRQSNILATAG